MENEWRVKWVPQLSNVCTIYSAGEHSVLSHPFNDDLGKHCSPLRVYECKCIYKRRIDSTAAIIFHSSFSIFNSDIPLHIAQVKSIIFV